MPGAHTRDTRQNRRRVIDEIWGQGWLQRIPKDICDSQWGQPEHCSIGLLTEIAGNTRRKVSLEQAIAGWQTALNDRTDFGKCRDRGIKGPTTSCLIRSDVASPNSDKGDGAQGKRSGEVFSLEEATDNQLRVEVLPRVGVDRVAGRQEPDYSAGSRPKRRKITKQQKVGGEDAAGPPSSPVQPTVSSPASSSMSDIEFLTCQGPSVAKHLQNLLNVLKAEGLLDEEEINLRYCDKCLSKVSESIRCIDKTLESCAEFAHHFLRSITEPNDEQTEKSLFVPDRGNARSNDAN